jgi:cytochrome c peroxidase
MKKLFITTFILALIAYACKKDDFETPVESVEAASISDAVNYSSMILPASDHFDSIPQDPKNPLTAQKVELGKLLFHDTRLAGNPRVSDGLYTYSCASCHHAEAGFQSGLAQAIGEGGSGFGLTGETRIPSPLYQLDSIDALPIRTPTILNSAYQEVMLWNGSMGATGVNDTTQADWTSGTPFANNVYGFQGLETVGITALRKHRFFIDTAYLSSDPTYEPLFDASFPDSLPEKRITIFTVSLAIAAYERTVLANQSPFQRWLHGDRRALTADENAGRKLFFGKAKCGSCHKGPALNTMKFYALAMNDMQEGVNGAVNIPVNPVENKGRGGFTNKPRDRFKFKVPQLYNLKDVKFFGHGASFGTVEEVVQYMNNAVPQNAKVPLNHLPKSFVPLGLTDVEIGQIVKFVEEGLYDPNLSRYEPTSVPSGNCIPNNDTQSKIDRGCQ